MVPMEEPDWTEQQIHSNSDGPQLSYEEKLQKHLETSQRQMWLLIACGCFVIIGIVLVLLRM